MRFLYLSHPQAMKAGASLHKCADLTEPSLLKCSKYVYIRRLRPHWIHQNGCLKEALLHM